MAPLNTSRLKELEAFLEAQDVTWDRLDREDRFAAVQNWISVFGNAFDVGTQYKEGVKARYALSEVDKGEFFLFSIPSDLPFWSSSEQRQHWGYKCKGATIPDLGQFSTLDFVMVASDLSWTIMYTHEDDVLGGPYFVKKDWIDVSSGDLKRGGRQVRRRRHGR